MNRSDAENEPKPSTDEATMRAINDAAMRDRLRREHVEAVIEMAASFANAIDDPLSVVKAAMKLEACHVKMRAIGMLPGDDGSGAA